MIKAHAWSVRESQNWSHDTLPTRRQRAEPRASRRSALILLLLAGVGCGDQGSSVEPPAAGARSTSVTAATGSPTALALSQPPQGLEAAINFENHSVAGRFNRLRFEARLVGQGQAVATFERVAGMTLVSTVDGPRQATLQWRGTTVDGFGPLSDDESQSIAHFADRLKVDELARIPLDLACLPGTAELDPAVGAALLLPWQVLLKYQPEGEIPTPREAAASSQCQYLFSPLDAVDMGRVPSPSVVALSTEQPVPAAVGYFPFDREGIPDTPAAEGKDPS